MCLPQLKNYVIYSNISDDIIKSSLYLNGICCINYYNYKKIINYLDISNIKYIYIQKKLKLFLNMSIYVKMKRETFSFTSECYPQYNGIDTLSMLKGCLFQLTTNEKKHIIQICFEKNYEQDEITYGVNKRVSIW